MPGTDDIVLALEPTTIAEWDVRDLLSGDPSAALALTTREQTAALLRDALSLPRLTHLATWTPPPLRT